MLIAPPRFLMGFEVRFDSCPPSASHPQATRKPSISQAASQAQAKRKPSTPFKILGKVTLDLERFAYDRFTPAKVISRNYLNYRALKTTSRRMVAS